MTWAAHEWPRQYPVLLAQVAAFGGTVDTRIGTAKELGPVQQTFCPPGWTQLRGRGGSVEFARLEQLCYLSGRTPEVLAQVLPRYAELCQWRGGWPDAYGPRLSGPLEACVLELAERPWSRRAVATVWNPWDVPLIEPEKPVPCTVALQFYVREDFLFVHAMMRSTDAWLGLYYDVPAFAFLGRAVALALGRSFGAVTLTTTSLHLYSTDLPKVGNVTSHVDVVASPLNHLDLPTHESPTGRHEARALWRGMVTWAGEQIDAWLAERATRDRGEGVTP